MAVCILNKSRGTSDEYRSRSMNEFRHSGAESLLVPRHLCRLLSLLNSSTDRAPSSLFIHKYFYLSLHHSRHPFPPCSVIIVMPRLLCDPNLAQRPDYTLDTWEAIRVPIVNPGTDHAQAAVLLTNIWNAQNNLERQQWQEQLDQDAAEAETRRQEAEEQERLRQEEIDKDKEEQRKEEEKKNTIKYAPIPDRDVPTRPPVIASAIATRRLEKGEYVPLWYFTNAGLEEAKVGRIHNRPHHMT